MGQAKHELAGVREADGELHISTTWAEWLFGVDRKTLQEWAGNGAPKVERGWWNPRSLLVWKGATSADGDPNKYDGARKLKVEILLKEEQKRRVELQRQITEGQYFAKSDVEDAWARRVVEVKTVLLALANKIAGEFSDPETRGVVERVVSDEVQAALEQYSREGVYTPKRKR